VLFIKSGLSIKGYIRSTFKDLKKQPTFQQLSLNYYTDWYSTNNEAQVITSLVRNIEKYFIRSFVLSILILLAIFLNEFIQINSTNNTNHKNEYLIMDDSGSFLTSEFSILISNINKSKESVYIIRNKNEKNGLIISNFLKMVTKNPERVVSIDIENNVIDNKSVIIKYKD